MRVRSADDLIAPAVTQTIQMLPLAPEDHAAAALAQRYAAAIDSSDDPAGALEQLGPRLLAVLESLGASPKARAQITKGNTTGGQGKLAALRAARPA
jgi:hypothetical protein